MKSHNNSNDPIIVFIESIINKKFDKRNLGYDPDQVDKTIDSIFEQFKSYIVSKNEIEKKYNELQKENESIKIKNAELTTRVEVLTSELDRLKSSGYSAEIINKRLEKIEEWIGNKSDDSKSKK